MDTKTLSVLEYPKILDRLAANCAFSASVELARKLQPSTRLEEIQRLLAETTEARLLLSVSGASVGGAHDVRPSVELARRGGVIDPQGMLDIKSTLISARELRKTFGVGRIERDEAAESKPTKRGATPVKEHSYPHLSEIARGLSDTHGLVDSISRTLSDRGEVLDSASPKLASLRREIRVAHDRLMTRLQRYLTDPRTAPLLQENLITQRDGRYVVPLRAENKGKIKAIVHDQSSSGATLFVEPLNVVEANNELRELELQERDEERRILAELSRLVAEHGDEIIWGVESLALLDLAFAKAKYAEEIHASEPIFMQTEDRRPKTDQSRHPSPVLRLFHARHPLLDPTAVVAIDFDIPEGKHAVVITGPNTGGKTVALKTVGLIVLMAQSGLHIPAQSGSELSLFKAVYADIGDEQSIQQSLSTFSGHITNIINVLKKADHRSLVVLDELGAGTDPQEGAALARAILCPTAPARRDDPGHHASSRTETIRARRRGRGQRLGGIRREDSPPDLPTDDRTPRPLQRHRHRLPPRPGPGAGRDRPERGLPRRPPRRQTARRHPQGTQPRLPRTREDGEGARQTRSEDERARNQTRPDGRRTPRGPCQSPRRGRVGSGCAKKKHRFAEVTVAEGASTARSAQVAGRKSGSDGGEGAGSR
ncbi:hypothetical protein FBQ79_13535 [Anaerolineae bacterium AMX1]|nr:hypothetical protein [Anaerolineae bacterium AMX1]